MGVKSSYDQGHHMQVWNIQRIHFLKQKSAKCVLAKEGLSKGSMEEKAANEE